MSKSISKALKRKEHLEHGQKEFNQELDKSLAKKFYKNPKMK